MNQAASIEPKLLNINAFCARYSIGRSKAYYEIAAGRLKSVMRGRHRFVRIEDAEAWLNDVHIAA